MSAASWAFILGAMGFPSGLSYGLRVKEKTPGLGPGESVTFQRGHGPSGSHDKMMLAARRAVSKQAARNGIVYHWLETFAFFMYCSHCHRQRTMLMEAWPPPSDGTV